MDNQKTGALIRQLRTDLGMTQKDLARQLAVTDRAVSKWERGGSLIVSQADGSEWRVIYGSCEYSGLWWAPDGNRYVLALETAEGTRLCLARLDQNSESNLNAYLTMGVQASELAKYDYTPGPDGWPSIRYEFLQWARDSRSMLLYYNFAAADGQHHEGYFWYDCESGAVRAVLEM